MRYDRVIKGNSLVGWLCEKLGLVEHYQAINDLYINFSHLHNSAERTKIGIGSGGIFDDSNVLRIAYLMHPLETVFMTALDPLHSAAPFFLLHADVTVVVRLDLVGALATVELIVHDQVFIVFQLVGAHLALEAGFADVLICWGWLRTGLRN